MPEPASAQAPAAGQRAGSGSTAVSGPSAGARRASVAGSQAGTQRAPAFSAVQGNAQSVRNNWDASRTGFIFQGPPFGPRATGLGTGKATSIFKTPAAYLGQRPGVSDPERAAFIRELEEGKLGPRRRTSRTRVAAGRRRPRRIQASAGTQSHPSAHPSEVKVCGASRGSSSPYPSPLLSFPDFSGPGAPSSRLLLRQTCALSVPPRKATAVPGEGRGAAFRRCRVPSEPALVRGTSDPEVGGQSGGFCQCRDQDPVSPKKQSWRWAEPQTDSASPPPRLAQQA